MKEKQHMALTLSMTIEEIKKKIKNEVPLQTIADLNGVDLKTFEKIIRQYEEEHKEQILPKRKPGRPKTSTPARSTKYARAKAEKKPTQVVAKVVPVETKIEVVEDVINSIKFKIRDSEQTIEAFKKAIASNEEHIESWKKILAVCKQKEAPKDD